MLFDSYARNTLNVYSSRIIVVIINSYNNNVLEINLF